MKKFLLILPLLMAACDAPDDGQEAAVADDRAPAAASADAAGEELGAVDFRVSCAPEVRGAFDDAVALLHHMMYQQARGAFEAVADRDPECAMAHWGIAMTLFQPLWPARPDAAARERGWDAVQRAKELGPATDRERALVAATEAFFRDPAADEWWPRIERWAAAIESAYEEHPDDLEIAAFHGLATLAVGQVADDQLAYNARAAEVLADVHEREALHPGAIHYTIHADDAAGRAAEHLDVVGEYSAIAPSVPHALHMPSHIYVRLGDWPEVIEWNRRSAEAALNDSVDGAVSLHHAHALDYGLYGSLQQGDDARARTLLEEARSTGPYQDGFVTAFHMAVMPARYALERRAWDEAVELEPGQPDYLSWDRYLWPRALTRFARGMGAVMTGATDDAAAAEARLRELRDQARETGEERFATYIEIDRLILAGRIAAAAGDDAAAIARTEEAAELEQTVQKDPTTPGALLPPYEALGDLLMELERPADAVEAYETSLDVWPGRYRSILGAARAADRAGDEQKAADHYNTLLEVVKDDSPRSGVEEAREVVEGV